MDARVDPLAALGLAKGDAHVLRNAGAFVSDDVLRSLILSQRLLGTTSIIVMAHTECGLQWLDSGALSRSLAAESGAAPEFAFGTFADVHHHVRAQVDAVRACPWLLHTDDVRGHVFDVASGHVEAVV
jgi:carbonic anhydrase